ncbi:MAG TPA: AI-2E family transporter [Bryobacteraceae bacterium]|nr:AI-2E family transporter [Bryobacteraceae bacterium]
MALLTPIAPSQRIHTTGLFLVALACVIALLYYGRAFCITLVISILIAFILDPFVQFFMRLRIPRGVASFLVCAMALSFLYLLGLGVYTQISSLADELPTFSQRANELVDIVAERLDQLEQNAYKLLIPKRYQDKERIAQAQQNEPKRRKRANEPVPAPTIQEVRIRQDRPSLFVYIYGYVTSFYNVLLMISFVPFLVYFMLSWRDHIRKSFLAIFQSGERTIAGKSWESIADMARAYVVGNFLLGILLSVASCICFWSWHLPYWMLVGIVSGFLSLVPYVGLPLAVIPPLLAALTTYATVSPYLALAATVGFFHLVALNLLYPQMVGARVHLNPLSVTVALMFWGTIWGALGLVLAIPITAGIKAVCDNVEHLQPYGKLLGD